MTDAPAAPAPAWLRWAERAVAALALAVVAWALATESGGIVHAHPAYPILLGVTVLAAAAVLILSLRARSSRAGWRRVLRVGGTVVALGWVAGLAWLRPATAEEPALAAMRSDGAVTVVESATRIVMAPHDGSGTAVLFQPGALVDARAYAAVLRPLAEAGHTVIITKQPLGIAFLDVGALDAARQERPELTRWVVGGHSLGGVVASMEADADDSADTQPVVGLLLFASYPAGDLSTSLTAAVESISGSEDGLSTPAAIEASRDDLPADAHFTVVDGAVHAFFGDYGTQAGDGTPTISHDEARARIGAAAVAFVDSLAG
ncbi:alpha/beta hydrolase [Demequina soli]|uniref:alpha/beta hydrolase n=1 Tax=Demequina soli TaxID=1638987 RepID=UPI0007825FC4|nr:alpha/beta hydrolase [Demequina soli]